MKMNRNKFTIIALFTIFMLLINQGSAVAMGRISGESRYDTAVKISETGWSTGAETVLLATGKNYPDALAGGPLAIKNDAPILLTSSEKLTLSTKDEIKRLRASKAIILGGKSAISHYVENELKSLGLSVERISGTDRYETAAFISNKLDSDKAIIASGQNFPDALSISSYAAKNRIPILLTKKDDLPKATKDKLIDKKKTIVMGGKGVVSDRVLKQLTNPLVIGGVDRYETNTISIKTFDEWSNKAFVATGSNFADALTGSVLAAKNNAPILLVNKSHVPPSIDNILPDFNDYVLFGGESAIDSNVYDYIAKFDNPPGEEEPKPDPEPGAPFTFLELGVPYVSPDNQLTITMNSIDILEYEGYNEYTINYTEKNNTSDKKIDQGSFKIYYQDSSEPQYGFFGSLYPGQSETRAYTFTALKTQEPLLVEYGKDLFFNQEPSEDTLKWKIEKTQ
ncbi:cell wall-binding repeat-containing protein [Rossellomorea sp. GCM10028870]|uniref:cell wall-binding repeat-containing protein n=1 Tax=Rossellomorea sp. GCM10028870 TaxID=3273426 RepID=UPI003612EB82